MRGPVRPWIVALASALLVTFVESSTTRTLTFHERVEAQRAIDRLLHSHQIGVRAPFEAAVPRSVSEAKVRRALQLSVALERRWNTAVTAELLRREGERIAQSSRLPERLEEIYRALGDDPVLIHEAFIRPILVDRLARQHFEADARLQAPVIRMTWEEWLASVEDELSIDAVPVVGPGALGRPGNALEPVCDPLGVWDNGVLDDPWAAPVHRAGHTAIWTGNEMIVWGGGSSGGTRGDRYDPITDTWLKTSSTNAPSPRYEHTAVWTGTEMIVWGGYNSGPFTNTGGRYNPVSDTWTPTSLIGAPTPRIWHTAIWTGDRMVIWGGESGSYLASGGSYDPSTDSWQPTSLVGAPIARGNHTAVWTGNRMIVWGGYGVGALQQTGGMYDPGSNTWTAMTPAPHGRLGHSAVWTGTEMIIWGGSVSSELDTGGRYDPATGLWSATALLGAPAAREGHTAIWTGSEMIVWGGQGRTVSDHMNSGGRYDPATDTWSATTQAGAPSPRRAHSALWTGDRMVAWGGVTDGENFASDTGGRYDPATDSWTPTQVNSLGGGPAVWTGNELLIWSGQSRGRRYDPVTDSWTDMTTADQPSPRSGHAAVWSGEEMIVWGGHPTTSGGRYDPLTDTWASIPVAGAPESRDEPTAVWTGTEMIVWGGSIYDVGPALNSGGRYSPSTDRWTPTSQLSAPAARVGHTAVWTGSAMIIWGGASGYYGERNDGASYDPVADTWTPTAPASLDVRQRHSAVWSGSEMIVFGGIFDVINFERFYNDGARYDPGSGVWTPMSGTGAPTTFYHQAAWTGSGMIVYGGYGNPATQYDPAADAWQPMASLNRPVSLVTVFSTIWTGEMLLVWSGSERGGGRWFPAAGDADGDGVGACDGDCDDANPYVHPGAADVPGNGADEDCDGVVACDPEAQWASPGAFHTCVLKACSDLVDASRLTREDCKEVTRRAKQLDVK